MADEPEASERSAVQPLEVDASAVVEKKAPVQLVKEDVTLTNSPGVKECGNIGKALVARPCIIFWAGIVLILVHSSMLSEFLPHSFRLVGSL